MTSLYPSMTYTFHKPRMFEYNNEAQGQKRITTKLITD